MRGRESKHNLPTSQLIDGNEVGDGGGGARGGRPCTKVLGERAHYLLQPENARL